MSEKKPTKEVLEENKDNQPSGTKINDINSFLKKDFYVEDPDLIIDEDTDEERKEIFKQALKKIRLIIPGYFDNKKKKRKIQKEIQMRNEELNNTNNRFVIQQKNDKDEREN